ncbi:MAG: efflux RND transporter periplasmic adaptor subunit [Thermoanaerobaculia bacterium]|nr:efflux RND transporter periplasmic adaptor subunit [Thermoanaerobaculia bacterium]
MFAIRPHRRGHRRLLAVLAVVCAAGAACYDTTEPDGDDRRGPSGLVPAVEAVQARLGAVPLAERLNGVVKADNQVAIHAEISAPVAEVFVRSGASVERGQALIRLEDDLLTDQLRQAEASLRLAQAEAAEAHARVRELELQVRRTRVLSQEDLVPELDLETQEAQLEALRAGADQAEVQARKTSISKTLIRAPVSGRVGRRNAEVGMLVGQGNVLFVIGSLDNLRVEIPLTEAMLGYVRESQPVEVSALALGERVIPATLSRISPFLSENSFSTIGEIDLRNAGEPLRPGMFVTVDILYGESEQATLVPSSAIWEDPRTGVQGVFVALEASAASLAEASDPQAAEPVEVRFRPVEIVAEGRSAVGLRGLEEGDWAITGGKHLLRSDAPSMARVYATTWERIVGLQSLQREDLVRDFLRRQQEFVRTRGATPPTQREVRSRILAEEGSDPGAPTGGGG